MTTKPIRAWHFVGDTLRDGRPIPGDGELLTHPGTPVLCESGLHASLKPSQALKFAPGGTLCLVECAGTILHQPDKLVCTERTIIARMDIVPLLREFARAQALAVVHLWEPPDIVLDYLMTGDEGIRAASWAASCDASWAASCDASWDASRAASRAASWDASRAASWAASRDAARDEFDRMVYECFEDWL